MEPIDVLFVVPEIKGYAQAGGMGDVAGELPVQLKKRAGRGKRFAVAMPWYGLMQTTRPELAQKARFVAGVTYPYLGDMETTNIFQTKLDGSNNQVDLFLFQNMKYFEMYGNGAVFVPSRMPYEQDASRFGCFCAALRAFLLLPEITVRLLHLHDWMMAPLAVSVRFGSRSEELRGITIVSTIHNASYQGDFYGDPGRAVDILLPSSTSRARRMVLDQGRDAGGGINFMQALIRNSNMVSTVSKNYRNELTEYGNRQNFFDGAGPLAPVFRSVIEQGAFIGIPNGLTYGRQPALYSQEVRRREIAKSLGDVSYNSALPVFSSVGRLVEQKFGLLLAEDEKRITLLEHILRRGPLVLILTDGDVHSYWGQRLESLSRNYPNLSLNVRFDPKLATLIYRCSDLFLMLSSGTEPFGITHLRGQFLGGVVPICHKIGGLADNTSHECSYAFSTGSHRMGTIQNALACIEQATSDFPGPDFMRRRHVSREKRLTWEEPAHTYLATYRRAEENNRMSFLGDLK
jgi:starch synthase